jgi:hypothetical protein
MRGIRPIRRKVARYSRPLIPKPDKLCTPCLAIDMVGVPVITDLPHFQAALPSDLDLAGAWSE